MSFAERLLIRYNIDCATVWRPQISKHKLTIPVTILPEGVSSKPSGISV